MATLKDIMTANPACVTAITNVHKARMIMAEARVRHLPVIDVDTRKTVGLLTQRALLKNAIAIVSKYGFEKLEHHEKSIDVASLMNDCPPVFDLADDIVDVARAIRDKKAGCACIEDNGKLAGIVTSSDFLDLLIEQSG